MVRSGALTFSLLLDWDAQRSPLGTPGGAGNWPQVSLAAALAVCEVVQEFVERAQGDATCGIKWPNDVHAAGRKICGVLPEVGKRPDDGGQRLVLGMGINVNNRLHDAPAEIQAIGTSLADLTGQTHDPAEVLVQVLKGIDRNLAALERVRSLAAPAVGPVLCAAGPHGGAVAGSCAASAGCVAALTLTGRCLLERGGAIERFHGGVIAAVN